jgi:hypothetical protein
MPLMEVTSEIPISFATLYMVVPPGRIVIEGVMLWESFSCIVVNTFTAHEQFDKDA